jgi:hypothetical protein
MCPKHSELSVTSDPDTSSCSITVHVQRTSVTQDPKTEPRSPSSVVNEPPFMRSIRELAWDLRHYQRDIEGLSCCFGFGHLALGERGESSPGWR